MRLVGLHLHNPIKLRPLVCPTCWAQFYSGCVWYLCSMVICNSVSIIAQILITHDLLANTLDSKIWLILYSTRDRIYIPFRRRLSCNKHCPSLESSKSKVASWILKLCRTNYEEATLLSLSLHYKDLN